MQKTNIPTMPSTLKKLIDVDSDKCVNCHQCISVCPSKFCNDGSGEYIKVNPDLCIGCGACIEACKHDARHGVDDFDAFMTALNSHSKIVAIVAPAIAANYPEQYLHFNGWLRSIGVQASFDVSFGAELTVKSYLEAIKKLGLKHVLAQPCPALVGYIQLHHPELLQYLAPADSPMMHTMKMVREYYPEHKSSEFVIISPCYAKRREFDEVGIGNYNVTYKSFDKHFQAKNVMLANYSPTPYDNPDAERAVLFSSPGGLLRTAQREVPGIEANTRKIEGRHIIYHYFDHFMESVNQGTAPLLVDCLNCEMGCNGGPGTLNAGKPIDEIESLIEKRNASAQQTYRQNAGIFRKHQALKNLRAYINAHWKPGLYDRSYANRSLLKQKWIKTTSKEAISEINKTMYKEKESDILNCCSCGYNSCEQMAIAIYNGLNRKENCRHYQKINIEKMQKMEQQTFLSEERKKIIMEINEAFQHSIENLSSVASAAEEMSATITQISENTNNSHTVSKEVAAKSETVSGSIMQLDNAAKEISKVVETINDIADQTKLLALNATIEAARSGEAGKGFSVVATEVKELAKQASMASNEISLKIESIQSQITNSVTAVKLITEKIGYSASLINTIATSIEEQSQTTKSISEQITLALGSIKNGLSLLNINK